MKQQGTAFFALGVAFMAIGASQFALKMGGSGAAFIALGAAFFAIGARKRKAGGDDAGR